MQEGVASWRRFDYMQQWRIYIRDMPRGEVDRALLLQAVIALGKQLQKEAQKSRTETQAIRKEGT